MEAMERLMAGRTAFMIAHRLSTLEGCDLRLQIDDGRLVREDEGEVRKHPLAGAEGEAEKQPDSRDPTVAEFVRELFARTP